MICAGGFLVMMPGTQWSRAALETDLRQHMDNNCDIRDQVRIQEIFSEFGRATASSAIARRNRTLNLAAARLRYISLARSRKRMT